MSSHLNYDYVIIGAGAAGLHLAMAFAQDRGFSDKRILILDPDDKQKNDRTWCFWEEGVGKWDPIVFKKWSNGRYDCKNFGLELDMADYEYKMVRAIDFYQFAKKIIGMSSIFEWRQDAVESVKHDGEVRVRCAGGLEIACGHVFDSRIPTSFKTQNDGYTRIQQHFLGWMVKTPKPVFDPASFTMMDTRVVHESTTCFTYVLPWSPHEALVEFTLFTPELINHQDYEAALRRYMRDVLNVDDYVITDTEYGVIPMSDFPFQRYHTDYCTMIGTAGGWVKPATGYSFKNAERFSRKILQNITEGRKPSYRLLSSRHRRYDVLLLDIFNAHNELGNGIFEQLYAQNEASQIFSFLDETTSLKEDLQIIASLKPMPFVRALARQWRKWL